MDLLSKKKLESSIKSLKSTLSTPIKTTEFINPVRSEPLSLSVALSLTSNPSDLYTFLKSIYIKEQSNDSLEYLTLVSAYYAGNYSEALFLAQDLLLALPSREVFIIILKLCLNHLSLPDSLNHFSKLALMHNPNDPILQSARAIACLSLLDSTPYDSDRALLLAESRELLEATEPAGKNSLLFKALTYAHLGKLTEALVLASEGMRICMSSQYVTLVALVMMAKEDYTGSLEVIKRGLVANPLDFLLYSAKLYCKYLMYEHTKDKDSIKKSIRTLLKVSKENPEDESSSMTGAIKEESSNIDSGYFEDIFKDIEIKSNESTQQALKLSFRIAVEIDDIELATSIYEKIANNLQESAVIAFYVNKKHEALEEMYEDLWACEILAQAKYDSGDKTMAVTLAKQAIRLSQNSKRSWSLLGKIYAEQNLNDEAMECYLSALRSVDIKFSLIPIYLEDF